jgi:hypothetical protein
MNVEIGTETVQFPEKEYILGFTLQCSKKMFYVLASNTESYSRIWRPKACNKKGLSCMLEDISTRK